MTALVIRKDRTPAVLRKLAKAEANPRASRRLLAIANALSGMSRKEAAEAAGMERQALRDAVVRHNAHGLDGLYDCGGNGRPPRLDAEEQAGLAAIVLAGPDPEADGISAFTREDSGAHPRSAFWQDVPSKLDEPRAQAAWLLAAKSAAKPSQAGPGRNRGL